MNSCVVFFLCLITEYSGRSHVLSTILGLIIVFHYVQSCSKVLLRQFFIVFCSALLLTVTLKLEVRGRIWGKGEGELCSSKLIELIFF